MDRKDIDMANEKHQLEMQNSKLKKSYEFDDILAMVGGFGRYTFLLYTFMCIIPLPIGLQQLVQVFYGATPKYSCAAFSQTQENNTCTVLKGGTCCEKCADYNFTGGFTSAVTEVRSSHVFFSSVQ